MFASFETKLLLDIRAIEIYMSRLGVKICPIISLNCPNDLDGRSITHQQDHKPHFLKRLQSCVKSRMIH